MISDPFQGKMVPNLILVASAESFRDQREPPFRVGDVVRLNSGGPRVVIVDFDENTVTVSWRGENGSTFECTFPSVCVHRAPVTDSADQ
jgi:uncharacterized protein YodC (DUF2158 family)